MLGARANEHHLSYQPLDALTDDPDFAPKAIAYSKEEKLELLENYFSVASEVLYSLTSASGEVRGRWVWLINDLRNMIYVVSTM